MSGVEWTDIGGSGGFWTFLDLSIRHFITLHFLFHVSLNGEYFHENMKRNLKGTEIFYYASDLITA